MIHCPPEALVISNIARLLMCKQECKYLWGVGGLFGLTQWCWIIWAGLLVPCWGLTNSAWKCSFRAQRGRLGSMKLCDFLLWACRVPVVIPKLALFSSQLHYSDSQSVKGASLPIPPAKIWHSWVLLSARVKRRETFTALNPLFLQSCFQHPSR